MVLRDLAQAVGDLGLVLVLTTLLLTVLFIAGWWLRRRALKLQIRAEKTERLLTKREQEAIRLYYTANFQQGISTELFGAVFTTLAFGVVLLIFQQYQGIQNRKAELVLQLGSPDNGFAVEAARQLRALDWLEDGTLQGADLNYANLQGAILAGADLRSAALAGADLRGANLWDAYLQGANLRRITFDDKMLLPDAESTNPFDAIYTPESYYQPGVTDMTRYTDPNHPDFWQPEWVTEQAEQGEG